MGLEAGTYVSDLSESNPLSSDQRGQGDDHLRLIKSVLKTTFPNASKPFYFQTAVGKTADFLVVLADFNKLFVVDPSAGAITATLPTLAAGDAGFVCYFMKVTSTLNPLFIVPASGSLSSGALSLTKTRRCIPNAMTTAVWVGTSWVLTRAIDAPVGAIIEFGGATLPVGFEWPNGQSLSSAANYPDYNLARGGLTTPDRRGRVAAGKDDMGGVSANRLTNQSGGLNGDVLEATGGSEVHTLIKAEAPSGLITLNDPQHSHTSNAITGSGGTIGPVGGTIGAAATINSASTGITLTDNGSDDPHNNVQPTIVENFLLVVE